MNVNSPSQPPEPERAERSLPWLPAEPDLPADRHLLLREHLMSSLDHAQRASRRRRLAIRVAAPVAVAAAAAGFVLTQSPQATGHGQVAARGGAPTADASGPAHIATVAYTLDRRAHGVVKVTIRGTGADRPDVARLQKDLAAMGVAAQVYQGDTCVYHPARYADGSAVPKGAYYSVWTMATRDAKGDFTVTLDPRKLPAGLHVRIAFPIDAFNTSRLALSFGSRQQGGGPACLHLPEAGH